MLTRLTIRWDDSMGCYRVNEPDWAGGVVVPAEVHDAKVQHLEDLLLEASRQDFGTPGWRQRVREAIA